MAVRTYETWQEVKHKGLFIVPSTDYNKPYSVRYTLRKGTKAYTNADYKSISDRSKDL